SSKAIVSRPTIASSTTSGWIATPHSPAYGHIAPARQGSIGHRPTSHTSTAIYSACKACAAKDKGGAGSRRAVLFVLPTRLDLVAGLLVELEHVVPVDQVIVERLEVLRPGVAIVDVVGVLPHVDAKDRRAAVDERVFAV